MKPTHLDLFSGIGGFSLASNLAGWRTIGFSEIDEFCGKILKRHWPKVKNYGDIKNIKNIEADLVTGGFPCQPFSTAGSQKGKMDSRYLWPEMRRVIEESSPKWIICENVPGIISIALDEILFEIEALRYKTETFIIPASAVGARHRRNRIWIVAYLDSIGFNACETDQIIFKMVKKKKYEQENDWWRFFFSDRGDSSSWKFLDCWSSKSGLVRLVHGLSSEMDSARIKAMGNSIVPQIPYYLLSCIPNDLR